MKLVEIFDSIDGEGIRAGELTTFIRFAGCNLRCSYCDTQYAQQNSFAENVSQENIIAQVRRIGNRNITITGGEPLLQKELPELLEKLTDYSVNIETNGSVDILPFQRSNTIITMDYKCPSSGMEKSMFTENLSNLRGRDVLKFVMQDEDFSRVTELLTQHRIRSWIFFSPVFGKMDPKNLVEYLKRLRSTIPAQKMRVQLQLHKVIWPVDMRGV